MTRPTTVHNTGNPQVTGDSPYAPPMPEAGRNPTPRAGHNATGQAAPQGAYPQPSADQSGYLPYPENGQTQAQFGRPPYPHGPGPAGETSGVRTLWILGFVLGAVGVLFPVAGVAGIVCGAVAWSRRSSRGKAATIVAIAGTAIGLVIGIMLYA